MKGHSNDLTHEKITQKYQKYNYDNMHVLEKKVTKEKVKFLGLNKDIL